MIYTVPVDFLLEIEARVKTLNKKAAKLSVPGVGYKVANTRLTPKNYFVVDVTIDQQVIKLAGYEFIATLQRVQDVGIVVRTVPGELIPVDFRNVDPWCDHCKLHRDHKDTYVVRDTVTGAYKQIGSSCLRDFLGHDPSAITSWMGALGVFNEDMDSYGDRTGIPWCTSVLNFMAATIEAIEKYGWLSKTKAADTGGIATAEIARDFLNNPNYRIGEDAIFEADEILDESEAHLESLGDRADGYEHNLRVVLATCNMLPKSDGLVASAVPYMRRLRERRIAAQDIGITSEFIGKKGDKIEFNATIVGRSDLPGGDYGPVTLVKFRTEEGNILSWFASGYRTEQVETPVRVVATIKGHNEFNGVKETIITRAKLEVMEDGK